MRKNDIRHRVGVLFCFRMQEAKMQDNNPKLELVEKRMLAAIHFMKTREPYNQTDTDTFVSVCEQSLYRCLLPHLTEKDADKILSSVSDFGCIWRLIRASEDYEKDFVGDDKDE